MFAIPSYFPRGYFYGVWPYLAEQLPIEDFVFPTAINARTSAAFMPDARINRIEPAIASKLLALEDDITAKEKKLAKAIKVTVKTVDAGHIIETNRLSVDTLPVGQNRLDVLKDVDPTGEIEGATLVYDAATDKYIVQKLTFANIEGDPGDINLTEIDGGTF